MFDLVNLFFVIFSAKIETDSCVTSGAIFQCVGRELQKVSHPVFVTFIINACKIIRHT